MVKQFQVYGTSRGEKFLTTSHEAARRFLDKHLGGRENAVFQGEEFARPRDLERVARGIYRRVF